MNYAELVSQVAVNAAVTQKQARAVLNEAVALIASNMKLGGVTTIPNLGTFTVGRTAARTGMNPRTRDALRIPAKKVPKLKIAAALKNAVN